MEILSKITAPIFLPGAGERASVMVLMVHGFTASPLEFRRLARYLNELGYSVHAVRLPGHGTSLQDMSRTRWADWWGHVVNAYEEIQRKGMRKIVTVGHSMGGLLALKLAMEKRMDGAVCLSTPIYIETRSALAEVVSQYLRFNRGSQVSGTALVKAETALESFYYEKPPLPCLFSLWSLLNQVKRSLSKVTTPLMISQGGKDRVVQPRSADYIYAAASSEQKMLRYYPNSSHALLHDDERDQLHEDIFQFLEQITG